MAEIERVILRRTKFTAEATWHAFGTMRLLGWLPSPPGHCDEYEFWEACEAGDTKAMENLLEAAADIDLIPGRRRPTPLPRGAPRPRGRGGFLRGRTPRPSALARAARRPFATAARSTTATMDALLEGGASASAAAGRTAGRPSSLLRRLDHKAVAYSSVGAMSTQNEPTARRRRGGRGERPR